MAEKENRQAGMDDPAAMMQGISQMLKAELPPQRYQEIRDMECRIEMPDGVKLYAKVFMPGAEGKWPVVLMRNPYMGNEMMNTSIIGAVFAKYGYAYVNVNVRGTLQSEGKWLPFEHEREDGRAVIDWIAGQEWCDGNIGTMGESYLGHVQWCIADYQHPMIKTMFIGVYGVHPYHTFYRRGMFREEIWTTWAAEMMGENRRQLFRPEQVFELQNRAYAVKPQIELGERLTGQRCEWYERWITAVEEESPYWSSGFWRELEAVTDKITIPVYFQGGWFDIFLRSQIESYRKLPEEVRRKGRFVIGPWSHSGISGGTLSYPGADVLGLFKLKAALEWFDYQLKGMEYPHKLGVIEAYSIGDNRWKEWEGDFCSKKETCWYLSAEAAEDGSGSIAGDSAGKLLRKECPKTQQRISYCYDPENPVESRGGTLLGNNRDPLGWPECSTEQEAAGARRDVISFVSEPLEEDIHMTGAMEAHLYVSSSAEATAFTVKVMEVFPDGRSMNIRDDITDIRWTDEKTVLPYEPGSVRELTWRLLDMSWRLQAGSRLRVDISSSNFPAYHVHPNVKACWATATEMKKAEQTIYCGGQYPSRIVLPDAGR